MEGCPNPDHELCPVSGRSSKKSCFSRAPKAICGVDQPRLLSAFLHRESISRLEFQNFTD